jgi:hypothetical protein
MSERICHICHRTVPMTEMMYGDMCEACAIVTRVQHPEQTIELLASINWADYVQHYAETGHGRWSLHLTSASTYRLSCMECVWVGWHEE